MTKAERPAGKGGGEPTITLFCEACGRETPHRFTGRKLEKAIAFTPEELVAKLSGERVRQVWYEVECTVCGEKSWATKLAGGDLLEEAQRARREVHA